MRTARAISAGGGVPAGLRRAADAPLVARRSARGTLQWTLPKGQQEAGETVPETALREVREETGLEVELVGPLDTIDYWFVWAPEQTRYHKFVHYFLMRAVGGDFARHDSEMEAAEWVARDEARQRMTFANERRLLALVRGVLAGQVGEGCPAGGCSSCWRSWASPAPRCCPRRPPPSPPPAPSSWRWCGSRRAPDRRPRWPTRWRSATRARPPCTACGWRRGWARRCRPAPPRPTFWPTRPPRVPAGCSTRGRRRWRRWRPSAPWRSRSARPRCRPAWPPNGRARCCRSACSCGPAA